LYAPEIPPHSSIPPTDFKVGAFGLADFPQMLVSGKVPSLARHGNQHLSPQSQNRNTLFLLQFEEGGAADAQKLTGLLDRHAEICLSQRFCRTHLPLLPRGEVRRHFSPLQISFSVSL
jgi:hypothetical protein